MPTVRIQKRDASSASAAELWPRIRHGLAHGYAGETRAGSLLISHSGALGEVESALDQACPNGAWRDHYAVMAVADT